MYSLYLHVMDGGHFQACGASPWNSSLQELSGGRSTLGARHLRPSRLSESAVRTTTWSPAAAPPLLLPSPVTTGCTNNLSARAQKIMERVGRGGTQGAGGVGGGASSYDQALKSLNEQWLQMRFTTQVSGSEVAVLKLSHRKFLAPGGLAKIKSQEDVFDVVVYGVTLCAMFLATPRHTALQRMKAQAKVERSVLHTHHAQEWSVSREESKDLVKRGVVISDGEEDAEVIAIELNKNPSCNRVDGETEVSVTDIPNFESLPEKLIAVSKRSFLSVGGVLFECVSFSKVNGFDDVAVALLNNGATVVSLLDFNGAGNMFPTVRQEHGIRLEDLKLPKVLFDLFPTYYSSPFLAAFDQILQRLPRNSVIRPSLHMGNGH
ncbi:hypothetical protein CY35_03G062700 [Sphagnum magellanicum]|nr:hypothetical protein CY35_03G062700 [Sphagnum magellanicum]